MSTEVTARADSYDTIIIGGGFFGCSLALYLRQELGQQVILLEREGDLLQRASYANQARVHNGYHYPRSLLTALRCRVNFARFVSDYRDCIVDDFQKYYAVGKLASKVTGEQYRLFCERIGAPLRPAPARVRRLFNPDLVDEVFVATEYAFDAVKLKRIMLDRLLESGVELRYLTEAESVRQVFAGCLEVRCTASEGQLLVRASSVLNCTYSRINKLLAASNLPLVYLKHELTEMALVRVPEEIRDYGITMMCGPFFSLMPFPARGLHALSHVRYTPHCEWRDRDGHGYMDAYEYFAACPKRTHYGRMVRDASRYVPCLAACRYAGESIWEVKTVLPQSEVDDSRPVLYKRDHGLPGLTCLMGGKIDNTYDILEFMAPSLSC